MDQKPGVESEHIGLQLHHKEEEHIWTWIPTEDCVLTLWILFKIFYSQEAAEPLPCRWDQGHKCCASTWWGWWGPAASSPGCDSWGPRQIEGRCYTVWREDQTIKSCNSTERPVSICTFAPTSSPFAVYSRIAIFHHHLRGPLYMPASE